MTKNITNKDLDIFKNQLPVYINFHTTNSQFLTDIGVIENFPKVKEDMDNLHNKGYQYFLALQKTMSKFNFAEAKEFTVDEIVNIFTVNNKYNSVVSKFFLLNFFSISQHLFQTRIEVLPVHINNRIKLLPEKKQAKAKEELNTIIPLIEEQLNSFTSAGNKILNLLIS